MNTFSNDEWQAFIDTVPCAMAKVVINKKLTILCANDAFFALSGRTREQYEEEVLNQGARVMYPDDFKELYENVFRQLNNGKVVDIDYRIIRRDGSTAWTHLRCNYVGEHNGFPVFQGVFMDISRQKELQEQMEYTNKRFNIIASLVEEVFFEYNINKDEMIYSGNYNNLFSNTNMVPNFAEYIKTTDNIYSEHREILLQYINKICTDKQEPPIDIYIKDYNGEYVWYNVEAMALFNKDGRPYRIVGRIDNIHQHKLYENHLKQIAEKDLLTNLYNQATTKSLIDTTLWEESGKNHALLVMDLDNFKYANDTYGHQFGDLVLHSVGELLSSLFRATDIIGRVGGDEFAVLLRDVINENMITEKLNLLMDQAKAIHVGNDTDYFISLSVGCCIKKTEGLCTYKDLFTQADKALYEAKKSGKNQFKLCSW